MLTLRKVRHRVPSSAGGGPSGFGRAIPRKLRSHISSRRRGGVVQDFLTTTPRPLHQRSLRCFFLMSRPPLLLLRRRGARLEPVPRLGLRSNLIRNLDTCAFSRGGNNILVSTQSWET